MEKGLCDQTRRGPTLITILGITPLTLLILMSIAGAAPILRWPPYITKRARTLPHDISISGPAGGPGLSEAAAELLKSDAQYNFNIMYDRFLMRPCLFKMG